MKIAVLNYQTGRADILENVPDEGEESVILFIVHRILDLRVINLQFAPRLYEAVLKPQRSKPLRF